MSAATATALSAQERAISEGKKVLHGTVTDRVLHMFEAIRAYGSPRVSLDRGLLFTESFKQTEHEPLVVRWAKALKNFAEKVPVTIFDDERGEPKGEIAAHCLYGIERDALGGAVDVAPVDI